MENIELIISLAATAASALIACVTFIVKLVRSVKARVRSEGASAILDAVLPLVEIAEGLTDYGGEDKKKYVLDRLNEYAAENGIEFDSDAASTQIERLIELSKLVNSRDKSA